MPFSYKDFFPGVLKSGLLSTAYEALPAAVARANAWVEKAGIRVINVETVVLPNIRDAEDASQAGLRTIGTVGDEWFQIVRVWYEI